MNYKKLFGWGIFIYAVVFLLWSGFVAYGMSEGLLPRVISVAVIGALALLAGKKLGTDSRNEIIKYSIGWVLIVAALDAIFTVPFTGWGVFAEWSTLTGYALILLVPLVFCNCECFFCKKDGGEETQSEPSQPQEPKEGSVSELPQQPNE